MLKNILDFNVPEQKYLFDKGYLISSKKIENLSDYPFYNNWYCKILNGLYFYIKTKRQK